MTRSAQELLSLEIDLVVISATRALSDEIRCDQGPLRGREGGI
jgi:hypothetical protein